MHAADDLLSLSAPCSGGLGRQLGAWWKRGSACVSVCGALVLLQMRARTSFRGKCYPFSAATLNAIQSGPDTPCMVDSTEWATAYMAWSRRSCGLPQRRDAKGLVTIVIRTSKSYVKAASPVRGPG